MPRRHWTVVVRSENIWVEESFNPVAIHIHHLLFSNVQVVQLTMTAKQNLQGTNGLSMRYEY